MNKINNLDKLTILIWGISSIAIGISLFFIPTSLILKLISIVIGITAIIISIKPLVLSIKNIKFHQNYFVLITSLVLFVCGIMMLINPNNFILTLIVIYLLAIPIWNILTSPNPQFTFHQELPKLIIGLIFLNFGFKWLVSSVVYIIAIVLIVSGINSCLYYFKK